MNEDKDNQDMSGTNDNVINDNTTATQPSVVPVVDSTSPPPMPDEAVPVAVKEPPVELPSEEKNEVFSADAIMSEQEELQGVEELTHSTEAPQTAGEQTPDSPAFVPSAGTVVGPAVESTPSVPVAPVATPAHHNNKKLAVVVTLLVGLLLTAVAVYVYMSAQSNTDKKEPISTADQSQIAELQPAQSSDVDQAVTETEEVMGELDDAADFNETELNDASLGL